MSSDAGSKPQTPQLAESKSARKKKAKAEAAAAVAPAADKSTTDGGAADAAGKTNGTGEVSEHAYIKELQK